MLYLSLPWNSSDLWISWIVWDIHFERLHLKEISFKGFTFSTAWHFLWTANNEHDERPQVFEYYIVSLAPKPRMFFIFPSKAAMEFSFWYKWCISKASLWFSMQILCSVLPWLCAPTGKNRNFMVLQNTVKISSPTQRSLHISGEN